MDSSVQNAFLCRPSSWPGNLVCIQGAWFKIAPGYILPQLRTCSFLLKSTLALYSHSRACMDIVKPIHFPDGVGILILG